MIEVVKARLEFCWRDVVRTVKGGNVLAEGELKLIGHCCIVLIVVVVVAFVAFVNL